MSNSGGILGGCALPLPTDESSPYFAVPEGSTLAIRRALAVPAGSARVWMQNGAVTAARNHYAPNCNLEVRELDHERPQQVQPGEYRIFRVQRSVDEIAAAAPLRLAALGTRLAGMDDGGGRMVYEGYHFWLRGPDPNVMRLSCRGALDDEADARPPSILEIRQSLGDIMHLAPPPGG